MLSSCVKLTVIITCLCGYWPIELLNQYTDIFDDYNIKTSSFDQDKGFGLRAVKQEELKFYHSSNLCDDSLNKAIKYVKMGKVREAEKVLRPAVKYLLKIKCKKIILGCTELPIAIFAYKSFKKVKESKVFIDPNLLLAHISMKKYKRKWLKTMPFLIN